jgi:N-glycosylase/DNA lyase
MNIQMGENSTKLELSYSCPFDIDVTLCCGQVFRWYNQGGWWYGVVGERVIKVRQTREELAFDNADVAFVKHYFGLHDDLLRIFSLIGKDSHIKSAIKKFKGLRIIRQELWECLISYICATYKNVAAIKQMLSRLAEKFGEEISFEGRRLYAFPKPESLAKASVKGLESCGLGYRAKYVSQTAKKVCTVEFDLNRLKKMSYERARNELLSLPGVGLKVADCIALFGLGKLEAFPVDVQIKRAVLEYYPNRFPESFVERVLVKSSLSNADYEKLSAFGRNYFGKYAGYAQEYLYHYERSRKIG